MWLFSTSVCSQLLAALDNIVTWLDDNGESISESATPSGSPEPAAQSVAPASDVAAGAVGDEAVGPPKKVTTPAKAQPKPANTPSSSSFSLLAAAVSSPAHPKVAEAKGMAAESIGGVLRCLSRV